MSTHRVSVLALAALVIAAAFISSPAGAQQGPGYEYKLLATNRTSTMEKELNEAADAGFRFEAVMGGDTAVGGSEVVAIVSRTAGVRPRFLYRLLATSKTSTMQKEMQEAADAGFEYKGQTVFRSAFGGNEVVCIFERDKESTEPRSTYRLLATSKTSTLAKELNDIGAAGYEILGLTVGKTAMGGKEIVAITRRSDAK